ncbi:MAG: hypothetical protein WAX04_00360 [Oscillospiraceae bacterium]
MYRKTFKDADAFLKKYWILTLIVTLISVIARSSVSLPEIFGVITLQPMQAFLSELILTFVLFPLSLGVIKSLDIAKYEEKQSPLYLFYFYTDFKRLGKALILGLLTASLISILTYTMNRFKDVSFWIPLVYIIFMIIVNFYLFLSSYIMVKNPKLSLIKTLKSSFIKIKGSIFALLFVNLTLGLFSIICTVLIKYSLSLLKIEIELQGVSVIIMLITSFFGSVVLYCLADRILTEQPQDSSNEDDETNYNEDTDYDESVDIEGYDSTQFDDDTLRNYRLFTNYQPIDAKSIEYEIDTQDLDDFTVQELYANEQIYFFLKDDNQVKKLFLHVYDLAKIEYQSYIDDTNTGVIYEQNTINSNKMSLEVSVSKSSVYSRYTIHVSFKINID